MTHQVPGADGLFAGAANSGPGSLVAGYMLEEQIGAGGMAVVFRARDIRLGRPVALKILSPALAMDPRFRQRFIRESRAAAAVDDPHIIPVFEAGEAARELFIAMRYVAGGDVRTLIRRDGPLPPARATMIISAVASALDAAHAVGLVHRDVKPANMLLDVRPGWPDHVYLSDFGLSNEALSIAGLSGAGQFFGTPDYAAPEQIQGRPVTGKADQYALACAAFEMLCGEAPFRRDQGMAVMWAHVSQPPPALTSRRPDLPAAANDVFARALAKAPDHRFGSCREFADSLREAFGLAADDSKPPNNAAPPVIAPAVWAWTTQAELPGQIDRSDDSDLAERPAGVRWPTPAGAVPAPRRRWWSAADASAGRTEPSRYSRPRHSGAQAVTGPDRSVVRAGGRRRPIIASVVILGVLVAAGIAGVAHFGGQPGTTARDPSSSAAAAVRALAAAWIDDQVAGSAIVACDPLMCASLEAHGISPTRVLAITPTSPDPLGSDVIAATAAVRSQLGSRLVSVYAPAVLASFGLGSSRIDIRASAVGGTIAYRSALRSDLQARRTAGADLLRNHRIWPSKIARQQLAAGAVDARLLIMLAAYVASTQPVRILAFGDAGPGASPDMPLRSVQLEPGRPGTSESAQSGAMVALLAFLRVQRPPLAPHVIRQQEAAGQATLLVEFTAPSPLGLLGTSTVGGR